MRITGKKNTNFKLKYGIGIAELHCCIIIIIPTSNGELTCSGLRRNNNNNKLLYLHYLPSCGKAVVSQPFMYENILNAITWENAHISVIIRPKSPGRVLPNGSNLHHTKCSLATGISHSGNRSAYNIAVIRTMPSTTRWYHRDRRRWMDWWFCSNV